MRTEHGFRNERATVFADWSACCVKENRSVKDISTTRISIRHSKIKCLGFQQHQLLNDHDDLAGCFNLLCKTCQSNIPTPKLYLHLPEWSAVTRSICFIKLQYMCRTIGRFLVKTVQFTRLLADIISDFQILNQKLYASSISLHQSLQC